MSKGKMRLENMPSTGLMRENQILQFIPISRSSWWTGVKDGRFPQPIKPKLSPRVTCWRAADIKKIVDGRPADVSPQKPTLN